MPVNFETSPSKVCPKCEPHLAATAGSGSAEKGIQREPSFIRRKKLHGHDRQVTFTTDYAERGTAMAEDNMALRFKAGYRRVNNSSRPSTYQMNYGWKDQESGDAPLIEAAHQFAHRPECPAHISTGGGGPQVPIALGGHCYAGSGSPTLVRKENINPVPVVGKAVSKRPNYVEPLAIPVSADEIGRDNRRNAEPLRSRNGAGGRNHSVGNVPSKSKKHSGAAVRQQKRKPGSPAGVGGVKKKKFSSPLKRLYERDYQRQALAKGMFETHYQMQYKDWLRGSWAEGAPGRHNRHRMEEVPPFTYGSLPVRTDPTDPRYLKHLPPPTLPHHPPDMHWTTNYEAHFVEPRKFTYEKGAWKSPENDKIAPGPSPSPVGGGPATPPPDVEQQQPAVSSWFDQLIELRDKAEHYKWKSGRTNFNIHNTLVALDPYEQKLAQRGSASSETTSSPASAEGSSLTSSQDVVVPRGQRFGRGKSPVFENRPALVERGVVGHRDVGIPRFAQRARREEEPLVVEDMEDSDPEDDDQSYAGKAANVPTFPAHCTCAGGDEPVDPSKVKGRVPTPVLRRSASPTRHHLDLTTPSENGLLFPSSAMPPLPYPQVSPKFRRDMRSTAPVNPLSDASVTRLIKNTRNAPRPVLEEVSSVPKHIPASSSPHHAHCVPSGSTVAGNGREKSPHHHVRKLDFDRLLPATKSAPKRSQPLHSSQPAAKSAHVPPKTRPTTSHSRPLSCLACGTCLQPGLLAPPSAVTGPGGGRTKVGSVAPPGFNPRSPLTSVQQQRNVKVPHSVQGTTHSGAGRPVSQQLKSSHRSREILGSESLKRHVRSCTPPLYGANTYAPSHKGGGHLHRHHSATMRNPPAAFAPQNCEVDNLSLSSMSLSSCSVASEILKKAKNRRDHFWSSQYHQARE